MLALRNMMTAVVAAIVTGLLIGGCTTAAAAEAPPEYVRTAHDGVIYEVTDEDAVALNWGDYVARGYPAWRPADTRYEKVLRFPPVRAVTQFARAGLEKSAHLTLEQYQSIGAPTVTVLPWGGGLRVFRWETSTQIMVSDDQTTFALTPQEWDAAGQPAFQQRANRGWVRMEWDRSGAIAYMCDLDRGQGGQVTFEQWTRYGSPDPYPIKRAANEIVYQAPSRAPVVSYIGPMGQRYPTSGEQSSRDLSFQEWTSMGSPFPVIAETVTPAVVPCPPDTLLPEK